MKTYEDMKKKRDKVVKHLTEFMEMCDDMLPEGYEEPSEWTTMDAFATALESDDFIKQFKPAVRKVEVWVARPYLVEVDSLNDEDAIAKVQDNFHDYERVAVESPNAMHVPLAENLLTTPAFEPRIFED